MTKSLLKRFLPTGIKKTLLLVSGSAALLLTSCNNNSANFSGTITGTDSDKLLVFLSNMNTREFIRRDTADIINNHFELQIPDSALAIAVAPLPKDPKKGLIISRKQILFFPGNHLVIEGDIRNPHISGSELYDGLAQYKDIQAMEQKIQDINKEYTDAYKSGDKQALAAIKNKSSEQLNRTLKAKMEAIKANPNTMAAAYFATEMKPEMGLEAISLLSAEVKNGPMGTIIQRAQKSFQNRIAKEKAKENIKPGKMAPDFKLKTIDGKEVTLASFKGKHLLLDFWGTWCGWCIKGIPEMKKYYAKYNKKVEFLGISCNDTEKKWRDGVAKHELPWVNTMEGDSEMTVKYAIGGFPTKILIDPEGKIAEVFVGETPELYKKMDELFK